MKRLLAAIAVLGVLAPAAAQARTHTTSHRGLLATVKVTASEFKFVLSTQTAKRGVVIFKVTNVGKIQHNFSINGRKTPLLAHGQTNTLRVVFLRKGRYTYKCTVDAHAAAGMQGVFTIT